MIKKLFNGLFKTKKRVDPNKTIEKLNKALRPEKEIQVLYEEVTEYEIRGIKFKLGDKVIAKSNECDPYLVGEIIEFWDKNGQWSTCIPYIKDVDGNVWGIMGVIKPYSKELEDVIKNLKPLEQYNYFVDDVHKYTEEQMRTKEEKYEKVQKLKKQLVS